MIFVNFICHCAWFTSFALSFSSFSYGLLNFIWPLQFHMISLILHSLLNFVWPVLFRMAFEFCLVFWISYVLPFHMPWCIVSWYDALRLSRIWRENKHRFTWAWLTSLCSKCQMTMRTKTSCDKNHRACIWGWATSCSFAVKKHGGTNR